MDKTLEELLAAALRLVLVRHQQDLREPSAWDSADLEPCYDDLVLSAREFVADPRRQSNDG